MELTLSMLEIHNVLSRLMHGTDNGTGKDIADIRSRALQDAFAYLEQAAMQKATGKLNSGLY